jgi:reactive intermediate/imine deaminase
VIAAACQPPETGRQGSDIEYLHMPGTEDSGLPFSSAVRVDNTLYLSGMIGLEPGTLRPAAGGIQGEARAAMEEIKKTLETFGSSMDRVVKCTVFLADEADRDAFNEIYMGYFNNLPARSGVTVKGLALGAKAEIECIAVVD